MSVPDARSYRLCRRSSSPAATTTLYEGTENRYAFAPEQAPRAGAGDAYRIEVLTAAKADYVTLVPYMALEAGQKEHTVALEAPDADGAPAWRMILRDDTQGVVLIDAVSLGRRFSVDPEPLPLQNRIRVRFYAWDWQPSKWIELGPYIPFQQQPSDTAGGEAAGEAKDGPWQPEIILPDAALTQDELLVTSAEVLLQQAFAPARGKRSVLSIEALLFPAGAPVFLSHASSRPNAEHGVVVAGDRSLAALYVSRTLGRTWNALLAEDGRRPFRRHFLTAEGLHIVQTDGPVETLTLDARGKTLARFAAGGENWHGTCSIDQNGRGTIMFAEYRATREAVGGVLRVWRSADGGLGWNEALSVPGRSEAQAVDEIRHFHTCQADPRTPGRWFVTSGDATHECGMWITEDDGESWERAYPTVNSKRDIRKDELQRLLRQTSFAFEEDDLVWATDDNVNGGHSSLVRCSKTGSNLTVLGSLGINLARSFVRVDPHLSVVISESKKDTNQASAYVINAGGKTLAELRLPNTARRATGFTYSVASRQAARGTFFTPTDGTTLTARDTVLRWQIVSAEPPARGKGAAAQKPAFAAVGGRRVNWFPAGFVPRDDDLLVLLRPQRVGGITVRNLLCYIYGTEAIYAYRMVPAYRHWPEVSEAELAPYRVYSGHAKFAPKDFARRCLYFGLVREPAQRLVSLYRYIRGRSDHAFWRIAQDGDIEAFYRHVHAVQPSYVSNLQSEFICGEPDGERAIAAAAEKYFAVGTLEHLDRFIAETARALRWPPARMRHDNKAQAPQDFAVTEGFLDFARQINAEDYRLYEFVRNAWDAHL